MAVLKKTNSILKKFKSDESGIAAISWAVSLTAIIGAMGAAMDFAMLSSADQRSQTIADTTALAAAIYVKNNEQIPQDRTSGLIGEYTAQELGYDYRNWVIDGAEGVSVNVSYDDVNREATVKVSGQTRPTLMQILGFDALNFNAETVVKYYEKDIQDPASVVLVLDNSGSMHFDDLPIDEFGNAPLDAVPRIDALKTSAKTFMTMLDEAVGPQVAGGSQPRTLRTGMMAFDSNIISSRTIPMDWGVVTDSEINAMTPQGATNSAPPMTQAKTWLNVNEPPVHEAENPGKTPLKYIILMTDGKNTVGDEVWTARAGTQNFRRYVTGRDNPSGLTGDLPGSEPTASNTLVSAGECTGGSWQAKCYRNGNLKVTHGPYNYNPGTYYSTWYNRRGKARQVICYSDVLEDQTCTEDVYETTWSGYEYYVGETPPPGSGWEEGEFDNESNIATRAECDSLHNAGVEIFSIGFALVPGQFKTNDWSTSSYWDIYPRDEDYSEAIGIENANRANGMLQYCASKPENFITANDSSALQTAFDRIGNTIIKEIIRISA